MARKKQRVIQHEMEEQGRAVVRQLLPSEWVVHDYVPDYGIDIAVEIFGGKEDRERQRGGTEAAGEWLLGQIRSTGRSRIRKLNVRSGRNEKLNEGVSRKTAKIGDPLEIEALSCRLETSLLLTVQAMGSGVPVILFLVTLDTGRLYFICVNDVIDKCIVPSDHAFEKKGTKTVYIPIANEVSADDGSLEPLRFLAKRPKLYAAFCRFAYQEREVQRQLDVINCAASLEDRALAVDGLLHLVKGVKRYDFWETIDRWPAMTHVYGEILRVEQLLDDVRSGGRAAVWESGGGWARPRGVAMRSQMAEAETEAEAEDVEMMVALAGAEVDAAWGQLTSLNGLYEEVCREWFLAREFAGLASG